MKRAQSCFVGQKNEPQRHRERGDCTENGLSLRYLFSLCVSVVKILLLSAMMASAALNAAPVGNTAAPQLIEVGFLVPYDSWVDPRAGYEGDFVADAKLKQRPSGRVDRYTQNTNSGTVTLNVLDRLDLYGVFGSSSTCAEWRFSSEAEVIQNAEMETFQNFLWGIGARAILFEWGNCDFGFGGRYSSVHNKPLWLTIDGVDASVSNSHCRWREWQINLDISYHIDLLTPYIGTKYSNAETHLGAFETIIATNNSKNNSFENRIPVGIYIGCGVSTGKYFMLNIEGRLVDEEAVTISGDLRF